MGGAAGKRSPPGLARSALQAYVWGRGTRIDTDTLIQSGAQVEKLGGVGEEAGAQEAGLF